MELIRFRSAKDHSKLYRDARDIVDSFFKLKPDSPVVYAYQISVRPGDALTPSGRHADCLATGRDVSTSLRPR